MDPSFPKSGAQILLESIASIGKIEYLFMNTGTDYAPVIEAIAKMRKRNLPLPKTIVVPHEAAALAMAHGFYLESGAPQIAMVHTIPGTMNASGALFNAASVMVPVILIAGRSPIREEGGILGSKSRPIHWIQELRDQGAIVRQFTKLDWENRSCEQIPLVLERAYEIAISEPRGPVYLSYPREIWSETVEKKFDHIKIDPRPSTAVEPGEETIEEIASVLAGAHNPLIITEYAGRDRAAVPALVELSEALSIPVVQGFFYLNFPTTHPLYAGRIHSKYAANQVREADAIFLIDVGLPWIPKFVRPRDDARIIQLGADPMVGNTPIWGFRVDLAAQGNSSLTLPLVTQAVKRVVAEGGSLMNSVIQDRYERAREAHDKMVEELRGEALSCKSSKPIDPRWLSHCIGKAMTVENCVVFCETVTSPFVEHVELSIPGSVFESPSFGHLGWALGAAVGARLANPSRVAFALCGDGAYIFSEPIACHYVSAANDAPIVAIIYNNQSWNASKNPVKELYPDGAAVEMNDFTGTQLLPSPDFGLVARSCGAHAETVEDPGEIPGALDRAIQSVTKKKTQSLLNVILKVP